MNSQSGYQNTSQHYSSSTKQDRRYYENSSSSSSSRSAKLKQSSNSSSYLATPSIRSSKSVSTSSSSSSYRSSTRKLSKNANYSRPQDVATSSLSMSINMSASPHMKHYQIASPISAVTSSQSSSLSPAMSASPRSKDLNGLSNYERIRLRQQQQKLQEEENTKPTPSTSSTRSSSFSSQHTIHANAQNLPGGNTAYHHSVGHNYYNQSSSSSNRSLRSVKSSSSIPSRPRKLSSSSPHHHLIHSPQSFSQQQLQVHRSRQGSFDNNRSNSSARHDSFDTVSVQSSPKIHNNNSNSVYSPFTSPDSSHFFSANSSPLQNNISPLYKSPQSHQGVHQLHLDTKFAGSSSGASPLSSSPVAFSAGPTPGSASNSPVLINPFNNFDQQQSSLTSINEAALPSSSLNTNKNSTNSASQPPNNLKKSTSRMIIKSHRSGSSSTHVSSSSHTYNDPHSTSGKAASVKSSHTTVFSMEDTLTADREILEMMKKNINHGNEGSSQQSNTNFQNTITNSTVPNGPSMHPLPKSAADMVRLHQQSPNSSISSPSASAAPQKKKSARKRFFGLFGGGSSNSNSTGGSNNGLSGGNGKGGHKGKDKKIDKNKIEVINQKIGVY